MASIANMLGDGTSSGSSAGKFIPTLKSASSLVQQILRDVQTLDSVLSSVVAKAAAVRGSLAGGPAGYGMTPSGLFAPAGAASAMGIGMPTATFGGVPATNGGTPGGGGGGGGGYSPWRGIATAAMGNFFGGAFGAAGQTYGNDDLYNRIRILNAGTFGGQSLGANSSVNQSVHNLYTGSFVSTSDRNAALSTMLGTGVNPISQFGGGVAQMARLNGQTLDTNAQAALQSISDPMSVVRLQAMGINMMKPNGMPASPLQMAGQIQTATGANYRKGDTRRVTADFSPYGPLRQMLEMMGVSDQDISSIYQPMFQASAATGMNIGARGFTKAAGASGVSPSLISSFRTGVASAQDQANVNQYGGIVEGIQAANELRKTALNTENSFKMLQQIYGLLKGGVGGLGAGPGGASPLGKLLTGAVHDYAEYKIIKALGGKGGKGLGSILGGGGADAAGADAAAAGGDVLGGAALGVAGPLGVIGGLALIAASAPSQGPVHRTPGGALVTSNGKPVLMGRYGSSPVPGGGAGMGSTATNSSGGGGGGPVSANALAQYAEAKIGTPYAWGGGGVNGPGKGFAQGADTVGFDCSSFMQYIFGHFGVFLPRTTYDQVKCGVAVSAQDAMPGDLLFFDGPPSAPGHVGMYLGDGQMIEAPHTGASVRVRQVDPASAVAIRRVMNAKGTVMNAQGGNGNASGAPANPYASALGMLTQNAIGNAQQMAGVSGGGIGGLLGLGVSSGGGGGASTGGAPSGPVSGTRALGRQMAAARGWTGKEWNSLNSLWTRESNWDASAVNKSSGAAGIPQDITGNMHSGARGQIAWGLNYIAGRYGDPNAAWAHEQQIGWYDKGAWRVKGDQPAVVHNDEMILPKTLADQVRTVLTGGSSGGGGGSRSVQLNVYPATADETAARHLATMVMTFLEEEQHFTRIAGDS